MIQRLPEKMRELHSVCINFKKLKKLRDTSTQNFCKKVILVLPEVSKKFEMYKKLNQGKKEFSPEGFLKNEVDDYFQKNFKKCATYLAWRRSVKKVKKTS